MRPGFRPHAGRDDAATRTLHEGAAAEDAPGFDPFSRRGPVSLALTSCCNDVMANARTGGHRRPPKKTAETMPRPGTVYAIPLGGGDYGACRVLATQTPEQATEQYLRAYFVFVVATNWRGAAAPHVADVALRTLLPGTHGKVVGFWISVLPPKDFRLLGVVEPTEQDRALVRPTYGDWEWLPRGFPPVASPQ